MAFVTLIRPPTLIPILAHTTPICLPLGLAYIASCLRRAGHAVLIIDAVGEAPFQLTAIGRKGLVSCGLKPPQILDRVDSRTDVFGLSCMFSSDWPQVRPLVSLLAKRFPHRVIAAGGEHATSLPEFTLRDCPEMDYCILGEGEETFVELLQTLEGGRDPERTAGLCFRRKGAPLLTAPRPRIGDPDSLPWPAWDLLPLENYLKHELGFGVNRGRSMPLLATRGCPYRCTFCSNPRMWTTRWVARNPGRVLEEIQFYLHRYQVRNIDFYDLTAIIRKDWIMTFARKVLDTGLRFTWQLPSGTRSEAIDGEVAELLYLSGCRNISYAPESGSTAVLQRIKKRVCLDRMKESMRHAVRSGINVKANIILGFPGETHREVWQTLKFLLEMAWRGVHDMSICPFTPYPGSELFQQMMSEGRISRLEDDYFYSLMSYGDLSHSISQSEHIRSWQLALYRIFGMAMFYGAGYLLRPWRAARTLVNILSKHQQSRLEMSLRDLLRRLLQSPAKDLLGTPEGAEEKLFRIPADIRHGQG